MAVSSYSEGGTDDPLIRLRERMRRSLTPVHPSAVDSGDDDPLARLDELIARAHDLEADDLSDVPEPLASVYDKIEQARTLQPVEQLEVVGDDPIDTIRTWIGQEAEGLGRREEPASRAGRSGTGSTSATASLEAILGREVLAMVADEPLSAEARAEAVALVVEALEDPSKPALRRVLRALLKG